MILIACLYPLKALKTFRGTEIINPRKMCDTSFLSRPYTDQETGEVLEWFDVPCGKCLGCRLDYSRHWAERIVLECKSWSNNWFLTLTYDDEHLPFFRSEHNASLNPDDLTAFHKALRQDLERHGKESCRFFACGEYGDDLMRPHYHDIIFNLELFDLKYCGKSELGYPLFTSDYLTKIWKRGIVKVAEVNIKSAAYVARYTLKKADDLINTKFYDNLGIRPEFVRMSRNPGIGAFYFIDNKDILLSTDKIYLPGGTVRKLPKYFLDFAKKNFDFDDSLLKSRRKVSASALKEVQDYLCSMDEYCRAELHKRLLEKRTLILNNRSFFS